MAFSKSLLIKGLAAGTALGGMGVAIHQRKNIATLLSPSSGKKKVWGGLECGEADGSECSINGEIFVKRDSDNPFKLTTLVGGKIKVYKVEGEGDNPYQDGFKFLIEDNDISGSSNNKLEQFETYEIKKGGDSEGETLKGKHYLSRKTEAKIEIKKALGLPNENCNLPDNGASQDCSITTENIKTIKFKEGTATVSGTVKLTIKKDGSKEEYPLGYKFSFKNEGDTDVNLTIGGTSITLKKNSPVEFKIKKEGSSLSLEKAWTLEELTKKVGLVKEGDFWDVGGSGINVKLNDSNKKTKNSKYYSPKGRVKVYEREAGYREGLKFTIEKGDLDLKDESTGSTNSYTLGQFQSFEIVKEENTWYLSKKDEGLEKIKNDLGLPCNLPTGSTNHVDCPLTADNIKAIKFDGKGEGDTSYSGTPKLTIYTDSGRSYYPLGYKFVFSSDADSTITIPSASPSSIKLKNSLSIDYKIKRSGDNNQTITLEKAWTPNSLMKDAVGFAEGSNGEWTGGGENGISVKQDSNKDSGVKINGNNSSKIKVYEEVPGYNQGFKFMVEGGDINLSEGRNNISKLSRYETYEVIKDSTDNNYYFTRKKKSDESIRELLGLPSTCSMPTVAETPTECDLDSTKINGIKFEGKGESEVTVTESGNSIKLKISKETSPTEFPLGYKFTFSSEQTGFTIPQASGASAITVNKGTETCFKIKESKGKLTLEKKSN